MLCPNCQSIMTNPTVDGQPLLVCLNCGGLFFEENGINRITIQSAEKLIKDIPFHADNPPSSEQVYLAESKRCPKDQTILKPLRDEETIPASVSLFGCPTCHGVLAFPQDLIQFKQAQAAKINYFKAWNKPLPALRTVLVMSAVILVLGGLIFQGNRFLQRYSYPSQASDLIKKINFSRSGRYLFVYFTTRIPIQSKIIFYDKTTDATLEKTITSQPSIIHQLTTGDLNLEDEIFYEIILTDNKGLTTKTNLTNLRISN